MSQLEEVFERTPSGKVGRFNFLDVPLIWVEGEDDVIFFSRMVKERCRFEAANGRSACESLAEELVKHDFPFAIIMDADYGVLEGIAGKHERVVYLDRYAIENYFFEEETLHRVCQGFLASQEPITAFTQSYATKVVAVLDSIVENVVLDVANYRAGTGHKAFPDNCAEFCDVTNSLRADRIKKFADEARNSLNGQDINGVSAAVAKFSETKGLVYLVRGHFAFSLIRQFLFWVLKQNKNKPTIDNRSLFLILANELARSNPKDQMSTRGVWLRLIEKTRTARATYNPPTGMAGQLF
jgi:hypothetical protein